MLTNHLTTIGLPNINASDNELNTFVQSWCAQQVPSLSAEELDQLYTYRVPKLGENGACSIIDELEEHPYDIGETLGIGKAERAMHPMTERLWKLGGIVQELAESTQVDWLGIYRSITKDTGDRILLKEAYVGSPSRAEFPLTEAFAEKSNNSTVGLTGTAVLFQDIESYEGPYYQCDTKVQSELCVPIRNAQGAVTGIIDAESFLQHFFTNDCIAQIAKVCMDLGTFDTLFSSS